MKKIIIFVGSEPCEIELTPQQMKQISDQRKKSERKDFFQARRILRNIERQTMEICKPIDFHMDAYSIYQNKKGNICIGVTDGLPLGRIAFDTAEHVEKIAEQFENEIEQYFDICQRRAQECRK